MTSAKIKILVLLAAFILSIPQIQAAINEGYGEDETSLGQFVDSFETSDNISVAVDVVRNSTLEAMELNFTGAGTPLDENYTLYTEVDANNRYAITDTTITVESLRNSDDHHYVIFDYGAGFFRNFVHDLEVRVRDNSGSAGNDRMWGWILANSSDEPIDMVNNNEEFIGLYFTEFDAADPNDPEISLREYENTVLFFDRFEPAALNTWYYFRINKTGTALNVGIYSTAGLRDAGDATDGDIDNLVLTLQNDYSFRYIYAVSAFNTGTPTVRIISGDIANLTIGRTGGGFAANGYFTTVDYLSDPLARGSALVAMTITDIPANTDIQLQFSNDTTIWTDEKGIPGNSFDLQGGRESIDLRLLNHSNAIHYRFNLSTADDSVTPRVSQSRLITTMGIPDQINVTGEWIEYQATSILNLTGVHTVGDLNSTFFIDGDTWNHTEVAGPPGHLIQINFTGVDPDAECLWVTIFYLYTGNVQHDFDIEMWNFTSSTWVDDGHLVDGVTFEWANSTIYAMRIPLDFLRGGQVRVQLNHEPPGNVNHELSIDYIRLIAKIPADVEAVEEFQLFWIVIAIALAMIILVLAKIWFEEGDP